MSGGGYGDGLGMRMRARLEEANGSAAFFEELCKRVLTPSTLKDPSGGGGRGRLWR